MLIVIAAKIYALNREGDLLRGHQERNAQCSNNNSYIFIEFQYKFKVVDIYMY